MNPADACRNSSSLASASLLLRADGMSVWLIGDLSHPEMANVLPCLQPCCQWTHLPDLATAIARLTANELPPELIVLVQIRPGEFGSQPIGQLRSLAPLSGYCVVLGSQCEGETRTGKPLLGMQRVFWHAWPTFWARQLDRLNAERLPAWALPATTSEEDRLLSNAEVPRPDANGCRVAILAESSESARALADAVASGGHTAKVWRSRDTGQCAAVDVVLWDASPAAHCDARAIQAVKQRSPAAPLIGVASFPRFHERDAALAAGVDAIVAKPFLLAHLLAEIERLVTNPTPQTPCG